MARSDLIVSLVRAGTAGDKRAFRMTAEAIIAEERAKHHDVLADRLSKLIESNGGGGGPAAGLSMPVDPAPRAKDFISEITPRRRLEDLVLPEVVTRAVKELVEEQRRADVLRAHGVELPATRPIAHRLRDELHRIRHAEQCGEAAGSASPVIHRTKGVA